MFALLVYFLQKMGPHTARTTLQATVYKRVDCLEVDCCRPTWATHAAKLCEYWNTQPVAIASARSGCFFWHAPRMAYASRLGCACSRTGLQEGKSTSQEGQRGSGQRVIRRGAEAREDTEHASDAEFSGMQHAARHAAAERGTAFTVV